LAASLKIYLFSGLGADRRVFEKLIIPGELIHIDWLTPFPDESLQQYSKRLIEVNQIESNQVLLGVSFGGIVASELAKLVEPKLVILISSVPNSRQLPELFKIAGYLHLYQLLPYSLLKKPNLFLRFAFSPIADEEYMLLKKIVADTEADFLKWAITQTVLWRGNVQADKLVHLHGTKDKIFPFKSNAGIIPVPDGGHFMTYNRAEEVSEVISKMLEISTD
jgi:pimeloyl-ACP methyl ester carboxylesterase